MGEHIRRSQDINRMATSFLIPEVYSACKPYTGIRSHPTSTRLSIVHNKCRTGQRLDREVGKILILQFPFRQRCASQ